MSDPPHGLEPEWFTPERCTWVVQDEFVNDETFLPVYPLEHEGTEITQEQADWVRKQLNRSSEKGYFGFNKNSHQYGAFVELVGEDIYGNRFTAEKYASLERIIFNAMAQVFWE